MTKLYTFLLLLFWVLPASSQDTLTLVDSLDFFFCECTLDEDHIERFRAGTQSWNMGNEDSLRGRLLFMPNYTSTSGRMKKCMNDLRDDYPRMDVTKSRLLHLLANYRDSAHIQKAVTFRFYISDKFLGHLLRNELDYNEPDYRSELWLLVNLADELRWLWNDENLVVDIRLYVPQRYSHYQDLQERVDRLNHEPFNQSISIIPYQF